MRPRPWGRPNVRLDRPSGISAQVNFSTADGTALAGTDYNATSGSLIIPAGETNGFVSVSINTDAFLEPNEIFYLTLANPVDVVISRAQATALILDRDALPCASISDTVTFVE